MSTKIKDFAVTLGIIILLALICIYAVSKIDFLRNIFGMTSQEMKVEDTKEYRALQDSRDSLKTEMSKLVIKDSIQGFWIELLIKDKGQNKIIYLNETKRIEKNTAVSNADELHSIIRSRLGK